LSLFLVLWKIDVIGYLIKGHVTQIRTFPDRYSLNLKPLLRDKIYILCIPNK
jgi:hypothetical protein